MYPMYFGPTLYAGGDPCDVNSGGMCANGTCGGFGIGSCGGNSGMGGETAGAVSTDTPFLGQATSGLVLTVRT